jgi:hypothetical protein
MLRIQQSATFRALLVSVLSGAAAAGAFQQDQRINGLTIQFGTDSFATANAFGGAFALTAQSQLQNALNSNIANGTVSLLLEMPGLTDLTGTDAPALQIGLLSAVPALDTNNPTAYSGAADVDWWYNTVPADVDANAVPKTQVQAAIVAKALTATASELVLSSGPLQTGAALAMSRVAMRAVVGSSSTPLESTNGYPPGHLPSERIEPSLVSFGSLTNGQWRGNISAASLAATPFALSISTDQGYTTNNSLLDVLVSGATTFGGFIRLVYATQPDQVDTNMPVVGSGPPYRFTANASKIVTGCVDRNSNPVPLAAGLSAAAYSAYFTFTTDRVIAHNVAPGSLQPPGLRITRSGANSILTVTAQDTTTCTIDYKDSLSDPAWMWLQTFTGSGAANTLVDTNTPTPTRFYRAQVQ